MTKLLCPLVVLALWWAAPGEGRAAPPTRAGKPPYETDGVQTWYSDPDNPTRNMTLRVARIRPVTLYRLARRLGIFAVEGSEILFSGLPTPATRELSIQQDSLLVYDRAVNGKVTQSWWDVSALTNPFLPPPAKLGDDLEVQPADKPEAGALDNVRWRHDKTFDIFLNEQGEAVDGSRLAFGRQGSVFVDDANRVFFTPPRGVKMFYPKPADVYEITGVTHLARHGWIVCEWTREADHNYHVVGIRVSTRRAEFNFALADNLMAHEMLTWVDDHRLLGQFVARKFSEYAVINLRTRRSSETFTDTGYTPVIVKNGRTRRYRFPKPDDD